MAHVASLGVDQDLDATPTAAAPATSPPPGVPARAGATSFELFQRLFADPAYSKRLYADLSASTLTRS
jgi:hypothetical protein